MTLYLYALADALDRVDGVDGVRGETPAIITLPFCVIVAGWIDEPPPVDREALARQDAVVRLIQDRARAVLPMRFGTSVADAAAATRAVEPLEAVIRERLELVRDREQMTMRVMGAGEAAGAGEAGAGGMHGPGRRYLERLAARDVPPALRPLLDRLEPLARSTRVEGSQGGRGVATVYQLIDRGAADAYLRAATDASQLTPGVSVRVTGPSPAYAFADLTRLR